MTPSVSPGHRRPVSVARRVPFPADAVRDLVAADPAAVLPGTAPPGDDPVVPLGIRITRRVHLQRDVTVGTGPFVEEDDGSVSLALWWEATHHPWLYPTFDGGLEIHDRDGETELRLAGSYQLPLGQVGVFADEVLGRRAARASLERFLEEIAAAVSRRLAGTRSATVDQA